MKNVVVAGVKGPPPIRLRSSQRWEYRSDAIGLRRSIPEAMGIRRDSERFTRERGGGRNYCIP